jgi:peptidoglycan/xylan/chitin deacetylase (PgdA/CDA1 family)
MDLRVGQAGAERAGRVLRRFGSGQLSAVLRPRDNVRVALLHDVGSGDIPPFRGLLESLLELRRPLTPTALLRMCTDPGASWRGGRQLAITFDDGLLSSYEATQAVLNPLDLKAAFFIPTAIFELRSDEEMRSFCVNNLGVDVSPGPERFQVMTRDHVVDLHRQGHAIFPHTHSHMALAAIRTPEAIDRELRAPRAILEDLLQEPVTAFALPFGDHHSVGANSFRAVERIYDACFTSIPGVNSIRTNRYRLRRDGFHPRDRVEHVMNLFEGVIDLPYDVKMWRLRWRSAHAR